MNASRTLRFAAVTIPSESEKSGFLKIFEECGDAVGKILGMPYKLVHSVDGEFGRQREDGSWTGMVGMLVNNTADLILYLSPNEERGKVIDFSFPHAIAPISFVTQKPEIGDKTFTFIQPFTGTVWLVSILSLLLSSLVFHRLLRGRYSFDAVVFNMFRNMLQDSSNIKAVGRVQDMLQMTWVIGMMLMAYFYTAVLLSFLSFPTRVGVRDIPELAAAVSKGTHLCLTFSGSFIPYDILKSEKESFKLIGQNLLQNKGDVDSNSMNNGLKRKGVVYVLPVNLLNFLRGHYFVSEDTFFQLTTSLAYQKNFCCADKLHTGILRASAAGLFDKFQSDRNLARSLTMLIKMAGEGETTEEQKLSLKDLSGVFLLLITGLVLASFVFILEIVSKRIQCTHRLKKKIKIKKRNTKGIAEDHGRTIDTIEM